MKGAVAALGIASVFLASCGGSNGESSTTMKETPADEATADSDDSPSNDEPQKKLTITMTDDLTFEPSTVVLKVGGKVTWVNDSDLDHTSTADPKKAADAADVELPSGAKPWNSGFVKPGESFSLTFDEPGAYRYFCIPHEKVGMLGTIEVVD